MEQKQRLNYQRRLQAISTLKLQVIGGFLSAFSVLSVVWTTLAWPDFDFFYFVYQGMVVNPAILIAYGFVYSGFITFHESILDKFHHVMSAAEKRAIEKTTNEVKIFIIYICQMLMVQSLYLAANYIKGRYKGAIWAERLFDIVNSALMLSYIFMYIGFSNSIKRTFSAQYKRRKMRKTGFTTNVGGAFPTSKLVSSNSINPAFDNG